MEADDRIEAGNKADRAFDIPAYMTVPVKGTLSSFELAREHTIRVYIDDRLAMKIVCTGRDLEELVTGRLLTEGIIDGTDDISSFSICEKGLEARVELKEGAGAELKEIVIDPVSTCCTDNRSYVERIRERKTAIKPVRWDRAWFDKVFDRLREGEELFDITHATHACYLLREDEVLCAREDIGRHNALDKAVGYGLMNGIDLSECCLFTTGRIPTDMVRKAVNSGVGLMASKTYPTSQAVEIASREGVTLITVRENGAFLIWTGQ